MDLSIRYEEQNEVHVLYVAGEIDAYTAPKLREQLIPLVERSGGATLVDLTDVTYIDSTGLGIFIGGLKAAHASEGTLTLTGLSERIKRLFSITGLDEVIQIEEDGKEEIR